MNERFNFYDVYGYIIPGFVLIGVLAVPSTIAMRRLPDLGLGDAVLVLLAAYVVGHLLYSVAARALPSTKLGRGGQQVLPSDAILEAAEQEKGSYHAVLPDRIRQLGLDLKVKGTDKEVAKRRRDAFLLCRDALVMSGKGAYAEQFEGMYTMMRGLAACGTIGCFYYFGWFLWLHVERVSHWPAVPVSMASWVVAGIGLLIFADFFVTVGKSSAPGPSSNTEGRLLRIQRWLRSQRYHGLAFSACAFLAAVVGYLWAGELFDPAIDSPTVPIAFLIGSVFLAGRAYASYGYFADQFAEAVFRNFVALTGLPNFEPTGRKST